MRHTDGGVISTYAIEMRHDGAYQPGVLAGSEASPGAAAANASRSTTRVGTVLLVTLVGFLAVAFLFRYQILSRFVLLSGNCYDQVIEVSILEHWFSVFRGLAHWSRTDYFYPFKGTLGYNDGYFLHGMFYSFFRAAHLDPYLSAECVSIVTRLIGFFGSYWAARRLFEFRPSWATLSAVLFTLSNNLFLQAHHAQLLSVAFAPVMAVLLQGMMTALLSGRRLRLVLWGASAGCLYAAWLMTAYYMAWYFFFFCTFLCASYAMLAGRAGLQPIWHAIRRHELPLAVILLVVFLASIPFLSVYLPKAHETGMHPYRAAQVNTLSMPDLVDVGGGNLLYGRIATLVDHAIRPAYPAWSERMTGFPPALLLLFACGVVLLLRTPRSLLPRHATLLRAIAIASLATWVPLFNIAGHSLWWFVYSLFPGAKAARVVSRYQIFLAAPVIGIAVFYLSASARKIVTPVLVLVCALLVAEEINAETLVSLDRPHELARLNAVPPPPVDCKAFFISRARAEPLLDPDWDGFYSHNVDAMIIAATIHLPTINGASTFQPLKWNLINPDKPDYLDRVRRYAAANHVTHLCSLDLRTMQWGRFQFAGGS